MWWKTALVVVAALVALAAYALWSGAVTITVQLDPGPGR